MSIIIINEGTISQLVLHHKGGHAAEYSAAIVGKITNYFDVSNVNPLSVRIERLEFLS